jgi:hypothetical protein
MSVTHGWFRPVQAALRGQGLHFVGSGAPGGEQNSAEDRRTGARSTRSAAMMSRSMCRDLDRRVTLAIPARRSSISTTP